MASVVVAVVAEGEFVPKLGVGARDIRPDPVGTEPLPVVGVLPADGAGVDPLNTEPARGLCSGIPVSLAVVAPVLLPARSTEAWREPKPPLKRLAARA